MLSGYFLTVLETALLRRERFLRPARVTPCTQV